MKRFLTLIAVFFALVGVVDVCCGFGFDYLKSHAKGGETYKHYYIAEKCEADVLILGSSRAARHYVPSIIEDSLGLSCYNAGEPGCGIIPAYAYYKMVAERHKPKLVIYEVTPEYDYFVADDYSKYLGRIRQYKYNKHVKELYEVAGEDYEGIKSISNMYVNNSCLLSNISDLWSSPYPKGYNPLYGSIANSSITEEIDKYFLLDSLKMDLLEKLVLETIEDNVRMVFVMSPHYYPLSDKALSQYLDAKNLAKKYSLEFYDLSDMDDINEDEKLFHDISHLNDDGAVLFTNAISSRIHYQTNNITR